MTARFITFEGIDGAGKSSHLDFACEWVRSRGMEAVRTYEPGGTAFGERVREAVLKTPTTPLAQTLAMFAARSAHVEQVIRPALEAGRWVVCDRFSDSTYAYQCGGHGVSAEVVAALEALAHPGLQPHLTLLFDIDPATAQERQGRRNREPDEFERQRLDFHVRVRNAYLERQRAHAGRIRLIDASGTVEEVRERVAGALGSCA